MAQKITQEQITKKTNVGSSYRQAALKYKSTVVLENLLLKYIEDIPREIRTKQEVDDEFFQNIQKG